MTRAGLVVAAAELSSGRTAIGFGAPSAPPCWPVSRSGVTGALAGAAARLATWERAGVAGGVGSIATQPYSSNQTSTQAWASVSRTIQALWRVE